MFPKLGKSGKLLPPIANSLHHQLEMHVLGKVIKMADTNNLCQLLHYRSKSFTW